MISMRWHHIDEFKKKKEATNTVVRSLVTVRNHLPAQLVKSKGLNSKADRFNLNFNETREIPRKRGATPCSVLLSKSFHSWTSWSTTNQIVPLPRSETYEDINHAPPLPIYIYMQTCARARMAEKGGNAGREGTTAGHPWKIEFRPWGPSGWSMLTVGKFAFNRVHAIQMPVWIFVNHFSIVNGSSNLLLGLRMRRRRTTHWEADRVIETIGRWGRKTDCFWNLF